MVIATFPAGDPKSLGRADDAANERNATVIYDPATDDFQVVTTDEPA